MSDKRRELSTEIMERVSEKDEDPSTVIESIVDREGIVLTEEEDEEGEDEEGEEESDEEEDDEDEDEDEE